jgi:hypothetical protein
VLPLLEVDKSRRLSTDDLLYKPVETQERKIQKLHSQTTAAVKRKSLERLLDGALGLVQSSLEKSSGKFSE